LENGRQLTSEQHYALLTNAYNTPQLANQRILIYPDQQVLATEWTKQWRPPPFLGVAHIYCASLEIKAVRDRYQTQPARVQQLNGQSDANSDESVVPVDTFDDFRSTPPANLAVSTVTLESGTYVQPSAIPVFKDRPHGRCPQRQEQVRYEYCNIGFDGEK
jgi:hypothetical protein